tara:strand:+ start:2330 stop:2785 length:456 start_codon:yes stop_codon:yes gene_type:complete
MKALLQRVSRAEVTVEGESLGSVASGLLVLLGVEKTDTKLHAEWLARKIISLRIFEDSDQKINRSVIDISGSVLVVSQFTLCADLSRGNRPGFSYAAAPNFAELLYNEFCVQLKGHGVPIAEGRFGAEMKVDLVNDGPFTIWLDTGDLMRS